MPVTVTAAAATWHGHGPFTGGHGSHPAPVQLRAVPLNLKGPGRTQAGAAPVRLRSSLRFIDIKSLVIMIMILSAFSCLYSLIDRSSSLTGRIIYHISGQPRCRLTNPCRPKMQGRSAG